MECIINILNLNLHKTGTDRVLYPILNDAQSYYQRPEFEFSQIRNTLEIFLHLHLSAYKDDWNIYRVERVPVPINGQETKSTFLDENWEYVAV